jgi:hypothetical protein
MRVQPVHSVNEAIAIDLVWVARVRVDALVLLEPRVGLFKLDFDVPRERALGEDRRSDRRRLVADDEVVDRRTRVLLAQRAIPQILMFHVRLGKVVVRVVGMLPAVTIL